MRLHWLPGILSTAYCLLFLTACAKRPPITADLAIASLTDPTTGKVKAGDLGLATLTDLRIEQPDVQDNEATVVVRIKAEQDRFGVNYKLSATLKQHYEWGKQGWELKRTETALPWVSRGPPEPKPYTQDMDQGGDSGAIQQLLKARKLARQRLNEIP
jgi:hypothetical protein